MDSFGNVRPIQESMHLSAWEQPFGFLWMDAMAGFGWHALDSNDVIVVVVRTTL